jgi:hypothetical protein
VLQCLPLFGVDQRHARLDARLTGVGADRAMTMMLGVPSALLSTRRARADAGIEQRAYHELVPLARPRKNSRSGVTDVATRLTERDARPQRGDVLLEEI